MNHTRQARLTGMMPEWFLRMDSQWKDVISTWVNQERVCSRCFIHYREYKNLGQWQCRTHTGSYNQHGKGTHFGEWRWDCCNQILCEQLPHRNGCAMADHIGQTVGGLPLPQTEIQVVPKVLFDEGLLDPACTKELFTIDRVPRLFTASVMPDPSSALDIKSFVYIRRRGPPLSELEGYPWRDVLR